MSKKIRRRRQPWLGIHPLAWFGGAIAIFVVLAAVGTWRSRPSAPAPPPSRSTDPAELLPLAQAGSTIRGGHNMDLIPDRVPVAQAAVEGVPAPRLALPSSSHDWGRVESAWNVTHIFAVQNTGTADLEVSNLVTSCGCTVAELSNSVIPPGERADLTVTFDADFHPTSGPVTRLVWFATNDPTQPWVEIRLDADVGS